MPLLPERKSKSALLKDLRSRVEVRTGLSNFSATSKTKVQMDVLVDSLISDREEILNTFKGIQISTANDSQTSVLGEDRGVPRLEASFASCDSSEQSFAFFVESGTFGDINLALIINIPAGTLIYSQANGNELGTRIEYRLTEPMVLDIGSSIAYGSVRATNAGADSNIGTGVLRGHNFTNYNDVGNNSLKCTNLFPILNGRNRESHENHKFRIMKDYDRRLGSNDARIRLSGIEVPGVADLRILRGHFGIGTTAIVVLGADYKSNPELISSVQARLNRLTPPGTELRAIPALGVYFDISIDVVPTKRLSSGERAALDVQLKQIAKNHFRSISLGGVVDMAELAIKLTKGSNGMVKIKSTGDLNKAFRQIYVRKAYPGGTTSEREQLVENAYSLEEIEFPDLGTLNISYGS